MNTSHGGHAGAGGGRSSARLGAIALLIAAGVALMLAPPVGAAGSTPGSLKHRIAAGQGRVSALQGSVRKSGAQLAKLNAGIAHLQRQIVRIEDVLLADRSKLLSLRAQLQRARLRLQQLERFQARAERVLAAQLVGSYETDRPDLITVVLEARGFADLLERIAFARRVRRADVTVTMHVRAARRAVSDQATRLGALELRQQQIAEQVLERRDALDRARISVVREQLAVANLHDAQTRQLGHARADVGALQGELARLEAAAARRAEAQASAPSAAGASSPRAASSPGAAVSPSQLSSGGGFVFPMPKADASPPGTWSLDQGVDISAPGDTPELAVCSGTIVLHGIGGFGSWAPVLHCDSALDGYSYVYYGHAGPADQLPVGTHVGAGQVMSSVGPGIVGISSGPHLEIGFCDASGTPLGGGTASTMMSLLQGSY